MQLLSPTHFLLKGPGFLFPQRMLSLKAGTSALELWPLWAGEGRGSGDKVTGSPGSGPAPWPGNEGLGLELVL